MDLVKGPLIDVDSYDIILQYDDAVLAIHLFCHVPVKALISIDHPSSTPGLDPISSFSLVSEGPAEGFLPTPFSHS